MDQNSDSTSPVMPAPTAPVSDIPALDTTLTDNSSDTASTNPAAVSAPPVPAPEDTSVADAPDTVDPSNPVVTPGLDEAPVDTPPTQDTGTALEVAKKISESQNVLIALSSDPSVDELSAAIGLSLFLDKLGKRATAIYSGSTPNALEFLKPEETFEPSVDTLQDFVIALNKEKADHLRYKLDGDYVKIFITPYKTRIGEDDLEFSYGDFNVDLVLALNIANGIDLDAALREHGRIMHDAVIINITTGNPGRFGEIEWSDKTASSVSEMITKILYSADSKVKVEKEEATAFLTGIVAATNRFSNAKTTPETMQAASNLMESGANQQLVSKNITPDVDNNLYSILGENVQKRDDDPTKLDIEHGNEKGIDETKEVDDDITEQPNALLDDLKAAEASLSQAGNETVPDNSNQPVKLENGASDTAAVEKKLNANPPSTEDTTISTEPEPAPESSSEPSTTEQPSSDTVLPPVSLPDASQAETSPVPGLEQEENSGINDKQEKVIQPLSDISLDSVGEGSSKYGKMLEDALSGLDADTATGPTGPIINENPASAIAPPVAAAPEINGVPEINYMPMPGEEVLPPPPAPPIDMNIPTPEFTTTTPVETTVQPAAEPIQPTEPSTPTESIPPLETTPTTPQEVAQTQATATQATDPSAFKIPGM